MAITRTGSVVGGWSNHRRLYIDWSYSYNPGDTAVWMSCAMYVQGESTWSYWDATNYVTLNVAGSENAASNVAINSSAAPDVGPDLILSHGVSVASYRYGGYSISVSGALTGFSTGDLSISGTIPIDATGYQPATAPSGFSAARSGGTSALLSWTNQSTDLAPYENVHMTWAESSDGITWSGWQNEIAIGVVSSYSHTGLNPAKSYKYAIHADGYGGDSGFVYSSPVVMTPSAPTSISVAQTTSGDPASAVTKNTITIVLPTNASTNPFNWTGWKIDKWSQATGTWATAVATITGTGTLSWDDTGVAADSKYQYRVYSYNAAGNSATVSSSTVVTFPYAPTGPTTSNVLDAVKNDNTITLSWNNPSSIETGTEVWHSSHDGVSWSAFSLVATTAANATSYAHTGLDRSKKHKYYVKNVASTDRKSTTLESAEIQLQAPPNAPILQGTVGPIDATEVGYYLSVTHQPVDASAQTYYEIEHADNEDFIDAVSTGKTAGTTSYFSYAANLLTNGDTHYFRARTWGAITSGGSDVPPTGASPWSTTHSIVASKRPVCNITQPSAGYPALDLVVKHTYSDEETTAQTRHRTKLLTANRATTLYDVIDDNALTEVTVSYALTNLASYVLQKSVADSDGMWSLVDEQEFTVSKDMPPNTPDPATEITAVRVSDTEITVAWTAPATANDEIQWPGKVPDDTQNGWSRVRVERSDNVNQAWTEVATVSVRDAGVYNDVVSYSDITTVANRQYRYRIKAEATRVSDTDPNITIISGSSYLTLSSVTETTPTEPSGVMASYSNGYIILTWVNDTYEDTEIELRRMIVGTEIWDTIATLAGDQTTYTDVRVDTDTTYRYALRTISGTLMSSWVQIARDITTPINSAATLYTINIPPVRRRGPRESEKENVESAEIAAIMQAIDTELQTLSTSMRALHSSLSEKLDDMNAGMEAAKSKTNVE